jgi:hypothetical protein
MLVATVGAGVAGDLGLSPLLAAESASDQITFGDLEPLVRLMQDTPANKLMPLLVDQIRGGTDLKTLTTAGALANVRSFAGEDYIGYHTFMALAPAYDMSRELPAEQAPLPVLKVLYRNTAQIQSRGGHDKERLHAVEPVSLPDGTNVPEKLIELVHKGDRNGAEAAFAALVQKGSPKQAFEDLQAVIRDITCDFAYDVHRVVLSWRAWLMLDMAGQQYAHSLLRQSLRYCLLEENHGSKTIRTLLPKLFDQYKLDGKALGNREVDDAWIASFSERVRTGSNENAAEMTAAALADGIQPDAIGEALSLAANGHLLHDSGRPDDKAGAYKGIGTCHGDSIGVHASDAINAWRNIARVSSPHTAAASLIVGAFHVALGGNGGQRNGVLEKEAYPHADQLAKVTETNPAALLKELDAAIQAKDQYQTLSVATRYAQNGGEARPYFDVLLRYATSEDGALHAEKYYRTVSDEFARTRPTFRWRHAIGLARVTASEFGQKAAGYQQAKDLLKV